MIEPIYPALGLAIRAYRRSRGIKVKDITARLGFTEVSSYYQMEQGKTRIAVHQLLLLAEIFEISPTALLAGTIEEEQGSAMEIKDETWREF